MSAPKFEPGLSPIAGNLYQPPWWLPGGHLQTVWRKLGKTSAPWRRRQRVELRDGDFIDIDHAPARHLADPARPVVLLVHGLAGSSSSPYILAMQNLLQQNDYHSIAINLRGCSGEYNRLPIAYHSGCSPDIEQVITELVETDLKDVSLAAIGYSLGANVLLKWASETVFAPRLRALVSVSNPFSLDLCCEQMNRGMPFWYGRYFLQRLRGDLLAKRHFFRCQNNLDHVAQIDALGPLDKLRTLWEFDDAVTAPLHGFDGAEDYYQRCSSRQFIGKVPASTLVIHGMNDPIIPPHALPARAALPAHVTCDLHPSGGHVGFAMSGRKDWLERRILDFIAVN